MKNMQSNYHTHTDYCDGKGTITDYLHLAREKAMTSLGFSSHAPLPFASTWCMHAAKLDQYLVDIAQASVMFPDLLIYKGLEVDYIPHRTGPSHFKNLLDYAIGSIHFVDECPDGRPWEIDGPHTVFSEGVKQQFHGDTRAAVGRYFELIQEMVRYDCPDIIGHLDKIKIQNQGDTQWREDDAWYQHALRETIDRIAASGAIVEVNTRGWYSGKSKEMYPGRFALDYMRKKNIPVTISSDAHHPDQLNRGFFSALYQLQQSGYSEVMVLDSGTWKAHEINLEGAPY